MITLIGHGYLGGYIQRELENQNLKYLWITHTDKLCKIFPIPHIDQALPAAIAEFTMVSGTNCK